MPSGGPHMLPSPPFRGTISTTIDWVQGSLIGWPYVVLSRHQALLDLLTPWTSPVESWRRAAKRLEMVETWWKDGGFRSDFWFGCWNTFLANGGFRRWNFWGWKPIFRRENVTKPFKRPGRLSENNVVERWQPGTSGKPGTWRDVQAVEKLFVGPTFVKSHETTPRSERSGMFGDHRIDVPRLMVQDFGEISPVEIGMYLSYDLTHGFCYIL